MMAMSAAPVRSASAHCDGTVNDKSYFPASGPFVKPQTSGAVFKYCTIDMRSFCKFESLAISTKYNREDFPPRQASFVVKRSFYSEELKMLKRSWCLFLLCFLCLPFAVVAANPDASQNPSTQTPSIAEKVAGAQKFPGYFNLYWDA